MASKNPTGPISVHHIPKGSPLGKGRWAWQTLTHGYFNVEIAVAELPHLRGRLPENFRSRYDWGSNYLLGGKTDRPLYVLAPADADLFGTAPVLPLLEGYGDYGL